MTIDEAFQLALQHHQSGRLAEAEALYRQILAVAPQHADTLHHLGLLAHQVGRSDFAVKMIRQAIALAPGVPDFHSNLGAACRATGQLEEAIAALRQAIALKPDFAVAHSNLGNALKDKGCLDEAIAAYRQAIALKADFAMAHNDLGNALMDKGCLDEAIGAYRQAIALKPDLAIAHNNLGVGLYGKGRLDEAIAAYRRAIAVNPSYAEAHNNLGVALGDKGCLDEAVASCRQAIALRPGYLQAQSNLVLTMNYHPGLEPSAIAEEHRRWNHLHAQPLGQFIQSHANDRSPERRLRIGYVSPDFREHSVAFFLAGLLEHHDPFVTEVFCYSDSTTRDAVTVRLERLATHWRKIINLSDSRVADLIRRDGIDILVDLAGHTANNRLLVFARNPAPVQVTWLGYPNTSGLDTIDYRITDTFADPLGSTEHLHSERLIRLPLSAWCYRPLEDSPPVNASRMHETGHITFGCFNAMPKINRSLLELWSRILLSVQDSRLLLKNSALGGLPMQEQLRKQFQEMGIGPDRVEMAGRVPDLYGHLATYGRVDIALDTFPYHGTTTTCEALWMGVPVVTLVGRTHVARVGVSLLSNLGHPEWLAPSPHEYVNLAVDLAQDPSRLAALRSTLRKRMEASPLTDAPRFARDIEAVYRDMWRAWCARAPEKGPP